MKYRLALLFIFLAQFLIAQSIERIEPPNWWVDMAHNEIEVMIYGENVADLRPIIPTEDVTLRKVIQVENPNYIFLQIKINKQAKAGAFDIDFYKRSELNLLKF